MSIRSSRITSLGPISAVPGPTLIQTELRAIGYPPIIDPLHLVETLCIREYSTLSHLSLV